MSISIIACPECNTLLLSDSVQCHRCQHVLDPARVEEFPVQSLPTDSLVQDDLDICVHCGETFRRGLVRCWNCGSFTRPEMAESYRQMQKQHAEKGLPTPPELREIPAPAPPAGERRHQKQQPSAPPKRIPTAKYAEDQQTAADFHATDDDFELAASVQFSDAPADAEGYGFKQTVEAIDRIPHGSPPTGAAAGDVPVAEDDGAESAEAARAVPEEPDEDHSVATGGDVLLQIAMQEEQESLKSAKAGRRSRSARTPHGFIVYCPNGHRIEVQERHRAKAGRCPRCRSVFFVPAAAAAQAKGQAAAETADSHGTAVPAGPSAGSYTRWMQDVHVHTLVPEKLKLKPGSLVNDFQAMDVAFSEDELLLLGLKAKGGLFGSPDKKKQAAREAIYAHLSEQKPVEDVPADKKFRFPAATIQQFRVVQPPIAGEESMMFAGVAVFGDGRIAVRVPKQGDDAYLQFLSFVLSEFREFAANLSAVLYIPDFGAEAGVPMTEEYVELTCHYSEQPLKVLQQVEFYKADPKFKVQLVGWRCEGCGLVVSEDSRKKEKIGGKSGKGIAKAKCPKCQKPFGNNPLYSWEPEAVQPKEEPEPAEATA